MALLKRELYRQAKGPKVTHADCCTLVFDTDTKDLYVEREVVHLEAKTGHGRVPDSHDGYCGLSQARRANRWPPRTVALATNAVQGKQ